MLDVLSEDQIQGTDAALQLTPARRRFCQQCGGCELGRPSSPGPNDQRPARLDGHGMSDIRGAGKAGIHKEGN